MKRLALRLGLDCDNACVFCSVRGLPASEPVDPRALEPLRAGADEMTFVGGEPTLLANLPGLVAAARTLGFASIGLQTNGRHLAVDGLARRLREAGLTDVHLSLHGATGAVHDHHVGAPGAFDELLAGAAAARAAGLELVATTVVTRSNFRGLAPLPKLLASAGFKAWCLRVVEPVGAAATAFDRLVPRLALALPFALHALDGAERLGLPTFLAGAPACLVGPYASRLLDEAPRAYAPACEGCAARSGCPGVAPLYLARFAGDELKARAAFTRDEARARLGRMFVELGESAPGEPPPHLAGAGARVPPLIPLTISPGR